ncbi:MAG: hypothetical protein Q8P11_03525 [bacterium]|nr:hypothetical protein [bacterium]
MKEVMNVLFSNEQPKENRRSVDTEELRILPESVRSSFTKLPDSLQNKIFQKLGIDKSEKTSATLERNLEEIITGLDEKAREEFMRHCLDEVFDKGKLDIIFEEADENTTQIETKRLLDTFWQNRGKGDDICILNKEYYEHFFETRQEITEKISRQREEIKMLKQSISVTGKQKRITEKKTEEMWNLEKDLRLMISELETFDKENKNSDSDHRGAGDVAYRRKWEKEWTKATAITCEYLSPDEFATMVVEKLESKFSFDISIEKIKLNRFSSMGSEIHVMEIQKKIETMKKTVDSWYEAHETDELFKKPLEEKVEKKQEKLIEYLGALISSYRKSKQMNIEDGDLITTIRQMEISLFMLGKGK